MQAGFRQDQVQVAGRFDDYSRISDEADRKAHVFHFCPDCGSQVFYTEPDEPDLIVVSVGSFADPSFPPPIESGYDSRRHPWLTLPTRSRPRPESGKSCDRCTRRESTPRRPSGGASCSRPIPSKRTRSTTSRAARASPGQTADAIAHLRRAIEIWERLPRARPRRLGLRPDPRGARLRRADLRLTGALRASDRPMRGIGNTPRR